MRLCEIVGLVGYALGGLPGERLLNRLGITSSDDTVLRRVKARRREAIQPAVRVLSVDDWAWRKKQRYGTMLMDLERSQVIDLLPERSADSFAPWLGLHPEVEVITRDRSSLYADGGRQGASSAVQITDRYHLVSNLTEAVERDLQQLQIDARKQLTQSEVLEPGATNKLTLIEARRQRCRQARYQRYTKVHELHRGGHTQLEIAEKVGIGAETVSRWLNAPAFPERRIRSDRRRDQALFLQSRKRGLQPSLTRTHYSAGRVSALLNMRPQTLSVAQKRYLDAFLRFCPGAHKLRQFVLQFRAMLRWRSAKRLTTWIESATVSGFRFTAQFARTLRRDLEAVKLSMATPWSNGPIEGQINRLKAIKRQIWAGRFRAAQSASAALGCFKRSLTLHRKCGRSGFKYKMAIVGECFLGRLEHSLEREAVIRPLAEQFRLSQAIIENAAERLQLSRLTSVHAARDFPFFYI
jgi:transposase